MPTSRSNMRRLRAGLIGSISAWLPSRRSTAHHRGARVITRSGQVRSATRMGSTSSANGRYRLTGIDAPPCGFHVGWAGPAGPGGLTRVGAEEEEVYASGPDGSEKLVTVIAPGCQKEPQTGASRTPATGSRSGSDPVAASEEEHPLHDVNSTAPGPATEIGGGLCSLRTPASRAVEPQ